MLYFVCVVPVCASFCARLLRMYDSCAQACHLRHCKTRASNCAARAEARAACWAPAVHGSSAVVGRPRIQR